MRRFFVEGLERTSTEATITGAEFTHLKKVLRLRQGDDVSVFDGRGVDLAGRIASIGTDSASVKIEKQSPAVTESEAEIILIQGLLKGDKPELIVQKATELGVKEICFYTNERTVPLVEGKEDGRLARWRKVAIEAAKQSGRSILPRIRIAGFEEAMEGHEGLLKVLLWEDEEKEGIKGLVKPASRGVAVMVGPEGGFSVSDVDMAKKAGFIPVSLGPRVLRSETAAVSIISILQYELGDMDSPRKIYDIDL